MSLTFSTTFSIQHLIIHQLQHQTINFMSPFFNRENKHTAKASKTTIAVKINILTTNFRPSRLHKISYTKLLSRKQTTIFANFLCAMCYSFCIMLLNAKTYLCISDKTLCGFILFTKSERKIAFTNSADEFLMEN